MDSSSLFEEISNKYILDKNILVNKCLPSNSGMLASAKLGAPDNIDMDNQLRFNLQPSSEIVTSASNGCTVDLDINAFQRLIRSEKPQLGESISGRMLDDIYKRTIDTRLASLPSNQQTDTRVLLQQAADILKAEK